MWLKRCIPEICLVVIDMAFCAACINRLERPQGKLLPVSQGFVPGVLMVMRQSSPTLGLWVGVTFIEDNNQVLCVLPDFSHIFLCYQR